MGSGVSFNLLPGGAFSELSSPDQLIAPVPGLPPTSEPGGAGSSIKAGSSPAPLVGPGAPTSFNPNFFGPGDTTFTLPQQNPLGNPIEQTVPFPIQGGGGSPNAFVSTGPGSGTFLGTPIGSPAPNSAPGTNLTDFPQELPAGGPGLTFTSPDQPAQPADTTPGATVDPTQIAPGEPSANPPLTDPTTGNFILPPGQAPFMDPQFPTTPGQFSPATLFPSSSGGFFDRLLQNVSDLFVRFSLLILGVILLAVAVYFLVKGDVPNPVKYLKV